MNAENKSLVEQVINLFYCIIFQGIPMINDAYYLSGANVNGKNDIREYSMRMNIYYIDKATLFIVTPNTLKQAIIMNNAYLHVLHTESEFRRLRDGFHSLHRALKENSAPFGCMIYVRALEALLKPQYGYTKRQFLHRCQTLVRVCNETQ